MITLYRLLMIRFARLASFFSVFLIFILLALHVAGLDHGLMDNPKVGPLYFMVFYIALLAPVALVSTNISWIKILPIKKRKLIFLPMALGVSVFAVISVVFFSLLTIYSIVEAGDATILRTGISDLADILNKDCILLFTDVSPLTWAAHLGAGNLFATLWTGGFAGIRRWGFQPGSAIGRPSFRWTFQWKRELKILAGITALTVLCRFVFTGLGLFLTFYAFSFFTVQNSIKMLGVYGSTRRKWEKTAITLLGIQIIAVLTITGTQLRSVDSDKRRQSLLFLGKCANFFPATSLSEKVVSSNQFRFRDSIRRRDDLNSLYKTMTLYGVGTVSAEDIHLFYDVIKERDLGMRVQSFDANLLPVPLTNGEVSMFLSADNEVLNHFALLRIRYFRDAAFIPVLLKNIDNYPDQLKLSALRSLSILVGQYTGIDYYAQSRFKHFATMPAFFDLDCDQFQKKRTIELQSSDEGSLNICLRRAVKLPNPVLYDEIERDPWIKLPVKISRSELVHKVLKMQ